MNLAELIRDLDQAGLDFQAGDILDALWLALHAQGLGLHTATAAEPTSGGPAGVVPPPPTRTPSPSAGRQPTAPPNTTPSPSTPATPIYAGGGPSSADRTVKATPVSIPAGRALPDRLALMRALRPFLQRWPSRRARDIDEARTAEVTAELRLALKASAELRRPAPQAIYPIFQPRRERWFDADVVIEDDPAVEVWSETIREFAQLMRETGAFRQVRTWRLRLRPVPSSSGGTERAVLETPAGGQVPTGYLAGRATRRLILFASHGASRRWHDGSYARVLEPWVHDCSVAVLHLMPRRRWKHSRLGDVAGLCHAEQPGATSAELRVEPYWWMIDSDTPSALLPLPAVSINKTAIADWALTQMARGRRAPVFLVDPTATRTATGPEPGLSSPHDFEQAIAQLRTISPDAFQLAVYLSTSPFTLPVARLVQAARFGPGADQTQLAELFVSGLLVARTSNPSTQDTDTLYFDFKPQAREILARSLQEREALALAEELQQRVSEYIGEIYGSPRSFRALVARADGTAELPEWAQPFAQVARSLLGLPGEGESPRQVIERFRASYPPRVVGGAARLAAAGTPPDPSAVEPPVWDALVQWGLLVQQTPSTPWAFLPGLADELRQLDAELPLLGLSILWADQSADTYPESRQVMALGARVEFLKALDPAAAATQIAAADAVVRMVFGGDDIAMALDLVRTIRTSAPGVPVILHTWIPTSLLIPAATEAGAMAVTDTVEALSEALKLIAHPTSRPVAGGMEQGFERVRTVLSSLPIDVAGVATERTLDAPGLARLVLGLESTPEARYHAHLRLAQAFAAASRTQLIVVEPNGLRVEVEVTDPQTPQRLTIAIPDNLRERVLGGDVRWVRYTAGGPTSTGLAIRLRDPADSRIPVGLVTLELPTAHDLADEQIAWLVDYARPLADLLAQPTTSPSTPRLAVSLERMISHPATVTAIAVTADGRRVATVSSDTATQVWTLEPWRLDATSTGAEGLSVAVATTADGALVVSTATGGLLTTWLADQGGGNVLDVLGPDRTAAAMTPDGALLVTGDAGGYLTFRDLSTNQILAIIQAHEGRINRIVLAPDGRTWTAGSDGRVQLWEPRPEPRMSAVRKLEDEPVGAYPTADGRRLVAVTRGGTLAVWDDGALQPTRQFHTQAGGVVDAAISPDGAWVVTVATDGVAAFWDLETGRRIGGLGLPLAPRCCIVTPDGSRVLVGGQSGIALLRTGITPAQPAAATVRVPGFLPSVSGFHFPNFFPHALPVGFALPDGRTLDLAEAANGLDGGMVLAVRDYFVAQQAIPPEAEPPPPDSDFYEYLIQRHLDSLYLPFGIARLLELMAPAVPDATSAAGLPSGAAAMLVGEWPTIRAELDAGRLVPLRLVKVQSNNLRDLAKNGVVLAYGYDLAGEQVTLHLYDPNYPDRDDIRLTFTPGPLDKPAPLTYQPPELVFRVVMITASTEPLPTALTPTYDSSLEQPPFASWQRYDTSGRLDAHIRVGDDNSLELSATGTEFVGVDRPTGAMTGYLTFEYQVIAQPTGGGQNAYGYLIPMTTSGEQGAVPSVDQIQAPNLRMVVPLTATGTENWSPGGLAYDFRTVNGTVECLFSPRLNEGSPTPVPGTLRLRNVRFYAAADAAEIPAAFREQLATDLVRCADSLGEMRRFDEQLATYDTLVAQFASAQSPVLLQQVARALVNKAGRLGTLGRYDEELAIYDELVARFGDTTDEPLLDVVAEGLLNKAGRLGVLERTDEELAIYDELIKRLEPFTSPLLATRAGTALVNKGGTLFKVGRAARWAGDLDAAERSLQECVRIGSEVGDLSGSANAWYELGRVAMDRSQPPHPWGDLEEAERRFRDALALYAKGEPADEAGPAATHYRLGIIARRRNRTDAAEAEFNEALHAYERLGDDRSRGRTLCQLGMLAIQRGQLLEAEDLLQQSRALAEQAADEIGIGFATCWLGHLAEQRGERYTALELYRTAEAALEKHRAPRELAVVKDALARLGPSSASPA